MVTIRPALPSDDSAVAELIYSSYPDRWTHFAGGAAEAVGLVLRSLSVPGTEASRDAVRVAESAGRVVGAVSAFAGTECHRRRRRELGLALRGRKVWHWPSLLKHNRYGFLPRRDLPPGALFIDTLATREPAGGHEVAAELLEVAASEASTRGLACMVIESHRSNSATRQLYESVGFRMLREASNELLLLYVRDLGAR